MQTNETISPAQFVEAWVPDYEQKQRELNVLKSKANTPKYCVERGQLCKKAHRLRAAMFTQALAAFEAHIRADEREKTRIDQLRADCEKYRQDLVDALAREKIAYKIIEEKRKSCFKP